MSLMQPSPVIAVFNSAATAGDVYVELGFIPAYVKVIIGTGETNSNVYEWFDKTQVDLGIATINTVLATAGSSGIRTKITTSGQVIERYAGGEVIAADETGQSDPKHVTVDGALADADHVTSAGVLIPKEIQVNNAANILLAYRHG